MSKEIAHDVVAEQPVDTPVKQLLEGAYHFSKPYVEEKISEQRALINQDLDVLQVMVAYSSPGNNGDEYTAEKPTLPKRFRPIAAKYEHIASDPTEKHAFDSEFVAQFLRKLGPSNHLRRKDGIDAAFELASMAHVLERDYENLPPNEQTPEKRMTEGYIKEELALLWAPAIPTRAAHLPEEKQGLIFNLDDPNVFTEEQLRTVPKKERWKYVGAQLAEECREVFDAIAASPATSMAVRIEAASRATDMEVRRLRILDTAATNPEDKKLLRKRIMQASEAEMQLILGVWNNPNSRRKVPNGKLFESVSLATTRNEMITGGDDQHLIRLALPREDEIHQELYPWISRDKVLVNLSADLIVEDLTGKFVRDYQVKAWGKDEYKQSIDLREKEKGKMIYPPERTDMIFLDDQTGIKTSVS